ncbi:hypothetical protein [Streptomyces sp. NPDC005046]
MAQMVLIRQLPARDEFYAYGVAVAYIQASAQIVDAPYEQWRDLINDIRNATCASARRSRTQP